MKISALVLPALSGLLVFGSIGGTPTPAKADTASTMAIIAGAAAIVATPIATTTPATTGTAAKAA